MHGPLISGHTSVTLPRTFPTSLCFTPTLQSSCFEFPGSHLLLSLPKGADMSQKYRAPTNGGRPPGNQLQGPLNFYFGFCRNTELNNQMAGSFDLMIGSLSIRMLLANSKRKKERKKERKKKNQIGSNKRKNSLWIPGMVLSQCLSRHSDLGVLFCCLQLASASVGPFHGCKMVGSKPHQEKVVCSGVSAFRRKDIFPQAFNWPILLSHRQKWVT